jgi:peptidyl-prolyl cis-trans isomerase A (cyclophilin A)
MRIVLWMCLSAAAALAQTPAQPGPSFRLLPGVYAVLETSMGTVTIELYERQTPATVENFIALAQGAKEYKDEKTGKLARGKPFYDGNTFHRVIDGFMIQTGDRSGSGTGGPGYYFRDEFNPQLKFDREGRVAMANQGPNTNGSQFFITVAPKSDLNNRYAIFGQVIDGMDVVKKISKVSVKATRPVTDVILKKVTIRRVKAQ